MIQKRNTKEKCNKNSLCKKVETLMSLHDFLHKHPIVNLLHDSECDFNKQIKANIE
jgi:hypothetical protein